jgi:hypothetical protein
MMISSRLLFSLAAALPMGLLLTWLDRSGGNFWIGWLASGAMLWLAFFLLVSAWKWAGGGKTLAWLIGSTFILRLAFGIFFTFAFPAWGYDTPSQNAGYIAIDAFRRDIEAVDLARSNQYLWTTFQHGFDTDQYGGMVMLSAWVYRYLSPDAHRTSLVLIMVVFVASLGLAFFWSDMRGRWSERAALFAGWIYAVYPDAVYFGSSQMREPLLIGLGAISFWGALNLHRRNFSAWGAFVGGLLGMTLISGMAALAVGGFLGLWLWNERIFAAFRNRHPWLAWLGWAVGVVILGAVVFGWLRSSAEWDFALTEQASGWVGRLVEGRPGWFKAIFITGYGLAQPVLPAALIEPTIPLFRWITSIRAVGWYLLAPLVLYGVIALWKTRSLEERRQMVMIAGAVLIWLVISSARAGGDQTDNPRYRTIFMPWLAVFAGWALDQALARKDAWLTRLLLVEAVFLGFFTNWYISRYTRIWLRLPFWDMVAWIAGISLLILAGGWIWDRYRRRVR